MPRVPVAVVNGTGYGGVELLRLLLRHPTFEVVEVTARSEAGKPVASVFPHLAAQGLVFTERVERADLVFLALPDAAAVELAPRLLAEGRRVVDLSAAFRLRDAALYPRWYRYEHPAPALLDAAVYGVPEWNRERIAQARLVACPGCFAITSLLALAPALQAGLIEPDVIIDGKSGVSGAGRSVQAAYLFSELNEDVSAYKVEGHRHAPEIAQELGALAGVQPRLTFTPHLAPMTRGILATCYATLKPGVTRADAQTVYHERYASEPFVRVAEQPPHTKWTLGSNLCFVYPTVDYTGERLIVIGALDNLVRGAAGQAIQCANILSGLEETAGLPDEGVYP